MHFNFLELKHAVSKNRTKILKTILAIAVLVVVCIYFNTKNHLLFHTTMEAFSITISFCIAIISIAFLKIHKKGYFVIMGCAFLFIGVFDFLHTLSYPGMSALIIPGINDLSFKLFIIARYMESLSFLAACYYMNRSAKVHKVFLIYLTISLLLILSVFCWRIFPECYSIGYGLTFFKISSEYIISIIQIANIYLLLSRRKILHRDVFNYLLMFFISNVFAEVLFTTYGSLNDMTFMIGHIFRFISYCFIYKALVKTSLLIPFEKMNKLNDELEDKNIKLQSVNKELERENIERQRIEVELSESEKRYRLLTEFMPDAIFIYNDDSIIYANKAAVEILGAADVSEIAGKPRLHFMHSDYKEIVEQRILKCKKEKTVTPLGEQKFVRLDGTIVDIESTGVYLSLEDEDVFLSAARDITERKHAEKLKKDFEENTRLLAKASEYDKLKNDFMANISHELRTPLNIIFSAVQLLELYLNKGADSVCDENVYKHTRVMKQNCYRLLRLVNNIIDITKIDSGFFDLQLKNCDIINVVEDVTMSVVGFAENKNITLLFDTDLEEKVTACDPDLIEQAMLNLLSNAVKFTNPGGNINVKIFNNENNVVVSVRDDGLGIPEDKINIIFERFTRVDKSLTRENEGSGIGLSLVKSIVEIHGGSISVRSTLGEGSEFIIVLPINILAENEDDLEIQNTINEHRYMEKIKIEFSDVDL